MRIAPCGYAAIFPGFLVDSMNQLSTATNGSRFLRIRDVVARTGLSRSQIYSLEAQGEFPPRRQLSERAVAWHEDEVVAWIETRPLARDAEIGDANPG